jgi:hypothetical protein
MNNNYNEGIKSLQNSVNDLNNLQTDISNKASDETLQNDWKKACMDMGISYINMPDIKDDPHLSTHLKYTALFAYEAYTRAAANPTKESHIFVLNKCIQQLIEELKKENTNSLPEWE